jgi:hypothetical protein
MSTYYSKHEVSSCEIAGAVALAALHDLRVNLFKFSGFPQMSISEASKEEFNVELSFISKNGSVSTVNFHIQRTEAFAAAKKFKKEYTHHTAIFEPVQKALAELEGVINRNK